MFALRRVSLQTYNCYGLEGIYCFGVNVTWEVSIPGPPLTADDELSIDVFDVRGLLALHASCSIPISCGLTGVPAVPSQLPSAKRERVVLLWQLLQRSKL
jgi:hypothetical protein